jgi:hypothetical protein
MLMMEAPMPEVLARVSPAGAGVRVRFWPVYHSRQEDIVLESSSYRFQSNLLPVSIRPAGPDSESTEPASGSAAWALRARRFGIDANVGSDTYHAAILLIASAEMGQNLERLARRTGVPRPFASKCARRLIDNGVWAGGQTMSAWVSDPAAREAFAKDVAVAEGKLLRRTGPGGRMEWAPAGSWNKGYEKSDENAGLSATYTDVAPRAEHAVALPSELETPVPAKPATADAAAPIAPADPVPVAAVPEPLEQDQGPSAPPRPAPSLEEIFSGAVWLR